MKASFLFIFPFLFLFSWHEYSYSQQIVLAAGGEATGSGGVADYSLGQIAYLTATGTQGSVNEGVQQPYEILFNSIYEPGILLESVAYPNPANSYLKIKIQNKVTENLKYRLYTLNGLVIREDLIKETETTIPIDEFSPGTYLLTILENNITLNSYKIIKQ